MKRRAFACMLALLVAFVLACDAKPALAASTSETSDGLEDKTLFFTTSRTSQFSINLPYDAQVMDARVTFQGLESYKNYSLLHTTQSDFESSENDSSEMYISNSLMVKTTTREMTKAGSQFSSDKISNLTFNNSFTPAALELSKCTKPVYLPSKNVPGGVNKQDASLAVDRTTGEVHIVWTGLSGNNTDVYYASSIDGGNSFSPPRKINTGADYANQSQACIALSSDGKVHIAWKDERSGLGQIYYACSSSVFANVKVDPAVLPNTDQSKPALAVGPDGKAQLVWQEMTVGPTITYRLCYAKSLTEFAFTPATQIGSGTRFKGESTIAVDACNRAHVAYSDDPGSRTVMYANSTNGTFANFTQVSYEGVFQYYPSIGVDANYNVYVAWQDTTDNYAQVYCSRLPAGASAFDARVSVSDAPSAWEIAPKLALSQDGKIWLAWTNYDDATGLFDIYLCNSTNGQTFTPRERISEGPEEMPAKNRYSVSLAIDASGYPHACWNDEREGWWNESAVYYTHKMFPTYVPAGYLNASFDLGVSPHAWENFNFNSSIFPYTGVTCWARSADLPSGPWSNWYMLQNGTPPCNLPIRRHVQLRLNLTSNGDSTPRVYSVTLSYDSYASQGNYTTFAYHSTRPITSAGIFFNATLAGQCNVFVTNDYINWQLCPNGGRVTFQSEGRLYAYRVTLKTDGKVTPEFEDISAYFCSIDYLDNITMHIKDDSLIVWSYAGRFDTTSITSNFASRVNYYLASHQNLIVNGHIEVHFVLETTKNIDESNSYAVRMFNISIEYNAPPATYEIPSTFHINEDTCEPHLIDLGNYFFDDFTSDLNYSIAYTNATVVHVGICDGHYLYVDAQNGSGNDNWSGTISVQVYARDDGGLERVSNIFTIFIVPVNDAPVIRSAPCTTASAGMLYSYKIDCFDIDGDVLHYFIDEGPANMSISPQGLVLWTPTYGDIGTHNVSLSVNDGIETVRQQYQIQVSGIANIAPKIKTLPEVMTNVTYVLDLEPYMYDEDTPISELTWSIIEGVDSDLFGPLLDKRNFTLTIVPTNARHSVGESSLLMQLEDPNGLFDRAQLKVVISRLNDDAPPESGIPIVEIALVASVAIMVALVVYYLIGIKGKRTKKEHDEDLGIADERDENDE